MGERAASGLPLRLAALVGRERERADLRTLLGRTRLVTLTGAGGSGKTRLALELATEVEPGSPAGAGWVDLQGLRDPGMVAGSVAATVGVRERPSAGTTETIVDHLGERRILLVLDNCEHLLDACATLVARILGGCPYVTVLATSREPLGLEGEVSFTVPPLSVPPAGARSAMEVGSSDAARLFELRARQVRPAFRLTEENASAVAEICRRLDGIPLALELAAARVRVLTPAQIAAGLIDRFRLLVGGSRLVPRQRTLEASVAWSYELLDETQQLALARLSVFAGGFGLDGAQAVMTGPGIEATAVLDTVAALADRSLLQVSERDGEARYRLLESIRLYARERLEEVDDPARVRDRHLAYHVEFAQLARAGLTGPEPEAWLDRLTARLDDLRAAMDWAVASHRPLAVIEIAEPTFAFWMVRGLYVEIRRRLERAVDSPASGDAPRARALTTASILALMGGDYPTGYTFAARAVPLARDRGDAGTLARALVFRSWCGFYAGEAGSDAVRVDAGEAIALAEEIGDRETLARALMYAGMLGFAGDSYERGRDLLRQALAQIEEAELTYMLPPAHAFLGIGGTFSGRDLALARQHARRGVELGRRIGQPAFVSLALCGLGIADALRGDERSAARHLAEARTVAERSVLPTFVMLAQRWTATAAYRFGRMREAREAAEETARLVRETGSCWDEAATELLLGLLALRERRYDDAAGHLGGARDASADPYCAVTFGRSLLGLAQLAEADEDAEGARELAHDGLESLAGYGDHLGVAGALETLGGLAIVHGRPERALRLLAAADRFHTATGISRPPPEAARYTQHVAAAREALDPGEAGASWTQGSALTVDEAVAYARRGRGERGRPRSGWQSLTPSEREVVRLVVEGHTNAEIGGELFVSVNTVKTHLSHVYTKLSVDGRTELAAEAARRDI